MTFLPSSVKGLWPIAASRLTRDLADDLAQDVLLVLHQKYPEVTELTDLIPLAFQVLRFKMLDLQRKRYRRGEYNQESIHDLPLADPHDNPATALEHKQVMDRLIASIERLGPRCRDLFRLKFEGKTFSRNPVDHGATFNQYDLYVGPSAAASSCWT